MEPAVVTWSELKAQLGSAHRARAAISEGEYRHVVRGAFAPAEAPDDTRTRLAGLRRVLPEHVVLSHWTSLWALGVDVLPRDRERRDVLDVVVPRGKHLEPRPGLRPHAALVTDDDLCELDGLLLVSAARACVDVTRSFGLVEGVACGDAALRSGATTSDRIAHAVERAHGLRGVVTARELLPHLDGRSESLMESRLRIGFVLAGGPRMAAQVDLYDEDGCHCGRGDLYLDGVVVEYDGREQRLLKPAFTGDRRRQGSINDLEVEIRRFTSEDYYKSSPASRLARLQRALDTASHRSRSRLHFGPDTLPRPQLTPLVTRGESSRLAA
jgi:hypothetical protein